MVLSMADVLTTPCLTNNLNPVARQRLKEQYRIAKRYGIKADWGIVTGNGKTWTYWFRHDTLNC